MLPETTGNINSKYFIFFFIICALCLESKMCKISALNNFHIAAVAVGEKRAKKKKSRNVLGSEQRYYDVVIWWKFFQELIIFHNQRSWRHTAKAHKRAVTRHRTRPASWWYGRCLILSMFQSHSGKQIVKHKSEMRWWKIKQETRLLGRKRAKARDRRKSISDFIKRTSDASRKLNLFTITRSRSDDGRTSAGEEHYELTKRCSVSCKHRKDEMRSGKWLRLFVDN